VSLATRPDRVAQWAVIVILLSALAAATSAKGQETGGASPPGETPAVPADIQLGQRPLRQGMNGPDVGVLQEILRAKRFGALSPTGTFDAATESAVQQFERAVSTAVDGVFSAKDKSALVGRMRARRATWYGPGFYGNQTACGETLTHDTLGVAHKTLPCGTPVTFYHGGRFLTVKVIDRGPFDGQYSWDLTEAAAKRLGFEHSGWVRSAHLRPGASASRR
jgi:rare lipoprotein A (peptidoglycan hydrolase)